MERNKFEETDVTIHQIETDSYIKSADKVDDLKNNNEKISEQGNLRQLKTAQRPTPVSKPNRPAPKPTPPMPTPSKPIPSEPEIDLSKPFPSPAKPTKPELEIPVPAPTRPNNPAPSPTKPTRPNTPTSPSFNSPIKPNTPSSPSFNSPSNPTYSPPTHSSSSNTNIFINIGSNNNNNNQNFWDDDFYNSGYHTSTLSNGNSAFQKASCVSNYDPFGNLVSCYEKNPKAFDGVKCGVQPATINTVNANGVTQTNYQGSYCAQVNAPEEKGEVSAVAVGAFIVAAGLVVGGFFAVGYFMNDGMGYRGQENLTVAQTIKKGARIAKNKIFGNSNAQENNSGLEQDSVELSQQANALPSPSEGKKDYQPGDFANALDVSDSFVKRMTQENNNDVTIKAKSILSGDANNLSQVEKIALSRENSESNLSI